jgi:dsDNA-specific endonuclease/ATPase MutS2
MFKLGDKIRVIDDNQKGTIVQIQKNRINILNEFGFEESFFSHEIILDKPIEVHSVELSPDDIKIKKEKKLALAEVKEIDLHIGQLVDSYVGLSNYEMLQIQLQKVESEIELARIEGRSRLIFIHGHGSGKLREEMMKLLQRFSGLEIYDASFRKYKLGATEVKIR